MSVREIKFRAWGETENHKMAMFSWEEFGHSIGEWIGNEERGIILMQLTGIKDKNGREIYEGDIIHGPVITDTPYTAECPSLQYFHWYQELEDAIEEGKQIEVIGNIYETPELLANQ
jgi:YopX protein